MIGACIEVHRHLGPGLLESAYEQCLCHELSLACVPYERQKAVLVRYKGIESRQGIGSTWSSTANSWWS